MSALKIIVVLPAAAHPFGNTAARWFYVLLKGLLAAGHQVVCFTVTDENEQVVRASEQLLESAAGPGRLQLRTFRMQSCTSPLLRKIRSLRHPFSEVLYADGVREALRAELRRGYDVLHLEQLWTGWMGLDVPRALLNIHHFEVIDWEGRRLGSMEERKAWWQMKRATAKIVGATRHMRMFSSRLLDKARSMNPSAEYWVVPFALDLSLYPMQPPVREPVIGLTGSMHWIPSRSAGERLLERIWPLIKKRVPNARLYIAGWNARKYLGRYEGSQDITIDENLPHPTDFFSKAAVMVYAPSRGSGMKIKVLESMAYGVPVVTTWEGVEGLDYANGRHCWVEEEDEAIAERAAGLLSDHARRRAMRESARTLMEQRCSSQPVLEQVWAIYSRLEKER